jgi:pimeloyl-ACP methyl ester carboxylesterase
MKERFFTFQGKKLFYRETGAGPAILLLHGFPFDGRIWLSFSESLKHSFRMIIPDLPGFGQSELPESQLHMWVMANAVAGLITHLGISKYVVVGHSMGGYIALSMASEPMTKGLAGIVLFHSQAAADDEESRSKRNESIKTISNNKSAFVDGFLSGLYGKKRPAEASHHYDIAMSQTSEAMASAMAGLRDRQSHLDWLGKANIPILFIIGKEDARMPAWRILDQAALVPHAELLLLQGVGHMGFAEAGDIIAPVVRDFCKRSL